MERSSILLNRYDKHNKNSVLPKAIQYRLNAIPIEIPTHFFIDLERTILSFIWKSKISRIAKTFYKTKEFQEASPSLTSSSIVELQ